MMATIINAGKSPINLIPKIFGANAHALYASDNAGVISACNPCYIN